jgi:hypothetical protein
MSLRHLAEVVLARLFDTTFSVAFPSPSKVMTSSGKTARISICPPSAAVYLLRVDRKMSWVPSICETFASLTSHASAICRCVAPRVAPEHAAPVPPRRAGFPYRARAETC